jgi:hypothetical protein
MKLLPDYAVLTAPLTTRTEALYPSLLASLVLEPRERATLYGCRGYRYGKTFVGQGVDRVLICATGSATPVLFERLARINLEGVDVSAARIDVQLTMVSRNADYLINRIEPNSRYQAIRIQGVNAPGATLYIGSPRSELRARIYNKSAESGDFPPGGDGEYVRFELQLRDSYADRMYTALRARYPRVVYLSLMKRMVDSYTYAMIESELPVDEHVIDPCYIDDSESWVARRKRWIETQVVPGVRKLLAHEPEYLDVLLSLLYNVDNNGQQSDDRGDYGASS